MRNSPYPCYFTPKGVELPKHCSWAVVHGGHIGPMGVKKNGPGDQAGMHWGPEAYKPETKDRWKQARAGWYVLIEEWHRPEHFARMSMEHKGAPVLGTGSDHVWLIPQLLEWKQGQKLVSAIPAILSNGSWQAPSHLIPLMDRLRGALLWKPRSKKSTRIEDEDFVQLAIDVISLNYNIGYDEFSLTGWLNTTMVQEVVNVAGGVRALAEFVDEAKRLVDDE